MGTSSIPVDLVNPGQVFACLGFLEAAEALCGPAEGRFTWKNEYEISARFELKADFAKDPVAHVLEFLADADITAVAPRNWVSPKQKKTKSGGDTAGAKIERMTHAPARELSEMALPIIIGGGNRPRIYLGHWADGSSRDDFKLYSGNRSALSIARNMIGGKLSKKGKTEIMGIAQLWDEKRDNLIHDPFGTTVAMGGSFNFDARCAWEAIEAGYSPDAQNQRVLGSPVVEMLAAWGLENARPQQIEGRLYRYAVWHGLLPPILARAALPGGVDSLECRYFRVLLGLSGKNKVIGFAQEETSR